MKKFIKKSNINDQIMPQRRYRKKIFIRRIYYLYKNINKMKYILSNNLDPPSKYIISSELFSISKHDLTRNYYFQCQLINIMSITK